MHVTLPLVDENIIPLFVNSPWNDRDLADAVTKYGGAILAHSGQKGAWFNFVAKRISGDGLVGEALAIWNVLQVVYSLHYNCPVHPNVQANVELEN